MDTINCGYWEISIEPNGRIKLPNTLLKLLAEDERKHFILSRGFGKNLTLWSKTAYHRQLQFFNSLDMNILKNRRLRNSFIIGIANIDTDNQNRIVIPKHLIQYAEIDKEMVIVLDNGMMEFWNKQTYYNEFNTSPEEFMLLNQEIHMIQNKNREEESNVS